MKKNMILTLAAAFMAITAVSAFAYQEVTTTDQNGVITSVNYQGSNPWFNVRNSNGEESRVYIDNDKSRGWMRSDKWDGNFVTGRNVRYQYEDRDHNRYAKDVYVTD